MILRLWKALLGDKNPVHVSFSNYITLEVISSYYTYWLLWELIMGINFSVLRTRSGPAWKKLIRSILLTILFRKWNLLNCRTTFNASFNFAVQGYLLSFETKKLEEKIQNVICRPIYFCIANFMKSAKKSWLILNLHWSWVL